MKEEKAYTQIFYDILENVLKLSESPSQFAEYLNQQIREIIGARTVLITIRNENGMPEIYSVFPLRRKEWCMTEPMLQLAANSFEYEKIYILDKENSSSQIQNLLNILDIDKSIIIPLNTQNRKVGSILLLDLMDMHGIESIVDLLNRLSGVFALIIRNSILYHNLEDQVAFRTKELLKRNEELQSAREEAIKQEAETKKILQTAMDGFWMINDEASFIDVNEVACKMLGFTRDELLQLKVFEIEANENKEQFDVHLQNVLNQGLDRFESKHKCKDGKIIDVEISVKKFPDRNALVAFIRDITERKKAEAEIIEAKEKAVESDRLKTAFLQNMSHEIRTPMNAIIGFTGFLSNRELSEEKRNNFISIIQNSSNQLLSVVTDILTVSSLETRQERLNLTNVCTNQVIVELITIFKTQASNKNLNFYAKQQLTDAQSEISTDKTKLTQILTNLITNALKFTHHGTIEFGYELIHEENGPFLRFFVKDTGIGINPEMREKIFERFTQADLSINKKYGGTGLGLSISKGFTDLLGGKIWVDSEPGKGSTFYFTVPYKAVNEHHMHLPESISKVKLKTILVAEDEEYNYLLIEELLNDSGIELIHAKDGQETIDLCKTNPNIDLILMDIKMPKIDGYQATKTIREFLPNIPIIAQSAYALEHEIKKYSSIFDDYLTKPIDAEELKEKVFKLLNNKPIL